MIRVRAALRLLAICVSTPPVYLLIVLTGLWGGRGRRPLQLLWGRLTARILGMEVVTEGPPPEPPYVLVTNHLSYVDIVALMSRIDCVFVAKAEIARWPLLGRLARGGGTIFVERSRKRQLHQVLEQSAKALEHGSGLVFFPEGTSSRGASVLPFRPSLFEIALRTGLPVHTASIHYETPAEAAPAWSSVAWWGDMTFPDHFLRLLTLPRIRARISFGAAPVQADDRKHLAEATHRAVSESFRPMVECDAS